MTVIDAPGTTAPLTSVTVPVITPRSPWLNSGIALMAASTMKRTTCRIRTLLHADPGRVSTLCGTRDWRRPELHCLNGPCVEHRDFRAENVISPLSASQHYVAAPNYVA